MFEHILAGFKRCPWRVVANTKGSVLPTFALALVPLVAMVGSAVDYSVANRLRTELQSALDAAVLAGARDGTANWSNVALVTFNANVRPANTSVLSNITPSFSSSGSASYTGTVSASARANFMGLLGVSSLTISARSSAAASGGRPGQFCVLSLNSNAPSAFQLNGNATIDITAPQCTLQVNSSSSQAVSLNGNTSITSQDNCFVGSVVKVGNATLSPPPDANCKPVADPFAKYASPAVGPCDYTNFSASGQATITLQPGVYCGGMAFSGQVNVTFAPGLYVIKDGVLLANGGSSFVGNGVTFFLTGQGASVQISGQANWHLVASTSGPLPGFVFFLDPSGPTGMAGDSSKLAGTSEMYFEGVIYFPRQQLTLTGGSAAYTASPYTAFIADTIVINGNGTLVINNDPTKTSVPVPSSLLVTWNAQPRLVQ